MYVQKIHLSFNAVQRKNEGAKERKKKKKRKTEEAFKRNGVWNSSEMLSILGGCPTLNPSLPKTSGVSQQGTNSKAPTNTHTMQGKPLNPTNTHNMRQSFHFVITGIICYHLRRNRRTNWEKKHKGRKREPALLERNYFLAQLNATNGN